jgi:predicted RNase H-like HicB family nuclease
LVKRLLVRASARSIDALESSTLAGARYLDLPYRIILTKEKRKGTNAWLALVEEFPGCEARGDTPEEATHALREEMSAWIANALEQGQSVPRPRNEPGNPDGRLALEIPQSLHEALTHAAVREGLTVEQLVTIALAGVIRWRPGATDTNGRWIQARAEGLMGGERQVRPGLRRAIVLNAALLAVVAVAAVVILVVALSHGF